MKVLDLLAEALSVYWRVIRRTWLALAAIFLPCAAVVMGLHWAAVSYFSGPLGVPLEAFQLINKAESWMMVLFGSFATVIVVRLAWRLMARPDDETPMAEGGVVAWGRLFGTELLIFALAAGYVLVLLLGAIFLARPFMSVMGPFGMIIPIGILVLGFFFGVKLLIPWVLAPVVSALFRASGFKAVKIARQVLGERPWAFLGYVLVAGLVSLSGVLVFRLFRVAELLNLVHPLSDGSARGVFLVLMTVLEILAMIVELFVSVVLVVYLRRTAAPRTDPLSVPRGVPLALAVLGGTLLAALIAGVALRQVKGPKDMDEARVFHEENIDGICTAHDGLGDYHWGLTVAMNRLPEGWPRRGCTERQSIWDWMKGVTVIWYEVPACSRCGVLWNPKTDDPCPRERLPDVAVMRHLRMWKGFTRFSRTERWVDRIGPADAVRPLTDKERELFRKPAEESASGAQ